jgi:hypothetical protein
VSSNIITYEFICNRLTNLGLIDFDAVEQPDAYDGGTIDMMVSVFTREINERVAEQLAAVTADNRTLEAAFTSATEHGRRITRALDAAHSRIGGLERKLAALTAERDALLDPMRDLLCSLPLTWIPTHTQRAIDAAKGGAK